MFRAFVLIAGLLLLSEPAEAAPRLGSRVTEFRASFGAPSFQEHLGRTHNVRWTQLRTADAVLTTLGAYALEVSALDGVVCELVVRCRRTLSDTEIAGLAQHFFPRRYRAAHLSAARRKSGDGVRFKLRHGDYVDAGPHQDHYVVSLSTATYWRHVTIFDREAAKVRPPMSCH